MEQKKNHSLTEVMKVQIALSRSMPFEYRPLTIILLGIYSGGSKMEIMLAEHYYFNFHEADEA